MTNNSKHPATPPGFCGTAMRPASPSAAGSCSADAKTQTKASQAKAFARGAPRMPGGAQRFSGLSATACALNAHERTKPGAQSPGTSGKNTSRRRSTAEQADPPPRVTATTRTRLQENAVGECYRVLLLKSACHAFNVGKTFQYGESQRHRNRQ